MAKHQQSCDVCDQIVLCREGTHPRMIAEMQSGFAVLGPHQQWLGYSLLLCHEPATELDELEPLFRRQYLDDVARLARAVRRAVDPHKLNIEMLGNQCHHLHWHVFPRFLEEPHRLQPIWQVLPENPVPFDPVQHAELIARIREELA